MLAMAQIQTQLRTQADAIQTLLRDVTPDQARWKPDDESWSILEVINHLADEERNDFRKRLDMTLHQPEAEWPPNDPDGIMAERRYNELDFQESVADFVAERNRSLEWLASLGEPDWAQAHTHPKFGAFPAGELMAAWLAHDLLHIRQLMELHYLYLAQQTEPYSLIYAGEY